MNILLVNTFYYPDMVGGAEHSVKILAEGLAGAGHRVAVLCENTGVTHEKFVIEEIGGVRIYRDVDPIVKHGGIVRRIGNRLRSFNNRHCRPLCERICEEFRPDIVHVNNVALISTYVWKYFGRRHIPIVFTARDYWILNFPKFGKLIGCLCRSYYRKLSNRYVDFFTAPSQYTLDTFLRSGYFQNAYSERVVNCVNFDGEETRRIVGEKLVRSGRNVRFLFVGTLGKYKGILNLLEAFRRADDLEITLTVCGSGEEESAVCDACREDTRIEDLGKLPSEELKQVYIACDVLVVPSVWQEPFGRIVIEGNQYGLPVIGSDRGGVKEILENTQTGEIFPAEDVAVLTGLIRKFSDRNTIRAYLPRIPEKIGMYSAEAQITSYVSLYERALGKGKEKNQ